MRPRVLAIVKRFGDPLSDYGISTSSAGQYALNASGLAQQLPPGTTDAIDQYASGAASFSGMTEAQQTAYAEQLASAIVAAIPVVGLALGPLLEIGFQAAGIAQAGPGCCGSTPDATNPYGSCGQSAFSWTSVFGSYPAPTAGTFEAFFEQIALADLALVAKCWTLNAQNQAVSAQWSPSVTKARLPGLLIAAVASWNSSHGSSGTPTVSQVGAVQVVIPNTGGTRTISAGVNMASGVFACGVQSANDPVSMALEGLAEATNQAAWVAAGKPNPSSVDPNLPASCFTGSGSIAPNSTLSFTVNNGPAGSAGSSSSAGSSGPVSAKAAGIAIVGAAAGLTVALVVKESLRHSFSESIEKPAGGALRLARMISPRR